MRSFNGYGLFSDIRDSNIRSYNRINTYLNIKDRHGKIVARKYLKRFNRDDQNAIAIMMRDINKTGYEQYRRDFIREYINV